MSSARVAVLSCEVHGARCEELDRSSLAPSRPHARSPDSPFTQPADVVFSPLSRAGISVDRSADPGHTVARAAFRLSYNDDDDVRMPDGRQVRKVRQPS